MPLPDTDERGGRGAAASCLNRDHDEESKGEILGTKIRTRQLLQSYRKCIETAEGYEQSKK